MPTLPDPAHHLRPPAALAPIRRENSVRIPARSRLKDISQHQNGERDMTRPSSRTRRYWLSAAAQYGVEHPGHRVTDAFNNACAIAIRRLRPENESPPRHLTRQAGEPDLHAASIELSFSMTALTDKPLCEALRTHLEPWAKPASTCTPCPMPASLTTIPGFAANRARTGSPACQAEPDAQPRHGAVALDRPARWPCHSRHDSAATWEVDPDGWAGRAADYRGAHGAIAVPRLVPKTVPRG